MKVCNLKKRIEISKTIGNFHIETFHRVSFGKDKNWTELHCWYDCEHCLLSWEDRSYEGECNDCGCYMAEHGNDYPKTVLICMLPSWIKKILLKHKRK